MQISEHWLRQWVNPSLNTEQLTEQMAMLGLTVDAVIPVAGDFTGVVVGEVLSTKQHPNADKLTCCEVSVGQDAPLSIVCGASNVRAGLKVAVATIGAVLPGDFKIKKAKLRGELSQGMLCSAKELQLQLGYSVADGIIELPSDAPLGENFREYFHTDDHILDVEISPNRGDCLSVRGLSRDVAAMNRLSVNAIAIQKIPGTANQKTLSVQVDAKADCPRYVGRLIDNINNYAETPSFVQQCLQRAGVRLINPVVDVCNYVMLELGQPMHAFDMSTLKNKIVVRYARDQEMVELLNDSTMILTSDDLVIADDEKVHAIAGIMGGKHSGVRIDTKSIFLEAAFFAAKTVCLSKRRHNINSDAAYRFERGVDFNLPRDAIERATELLLRIVGGRAADIVEVVSLEHLPSRDTIMLEKNQIERILGITLSDAKVKSIFTSLKMNVRTHAYSFEITPPSFRFDILLPIDLIEECARMTGYEAIPQSPMIAALAMQPHTENKVCEKRLAHCLVDRGYHEAMTYSFISPELHALFSPGVASMTLKNPLSQDMSVMRATLLAGLSKALVLNLRHQCDRVRLFEIGLCFVPQHNGELLQIPRLGFVVTGPAVSEQWGETNRAVDFYDLKADVVSLLTLSNVTAEYQWRAQTHPVLHPGRASALIRHDKVVGWLGELHPTVLAHLDVRQPILVCEIDWLAITQGRVAQYTPFSRFPMVRRDLAVVVNEFVSVDQLCRVVMSDAPACLQDMHIFDVYQGRGIESGKKSVALGLTFAHPARTLRDEEINEIIHDVVTKLQKDLDATLRA